MSTLQSKTPTEFFKGRIEKAIAHQNVESSDDTTFYLTQLLAAFVRPEALYERAGVDPDQPLAEIFCEALSRDDHQRLELLKLTGDLALFVSGFYSESLNRSLVSPAYYVRLGGQAYGYLSCEHRFLKAIFAELAQKFVQFTEVLSEVSEQCALTDAANLLRLYERWLATGNERSADLLRQQGILVVPSSNAVH